MLNHFFVFFLISVVTCAQSGKPEWYHATWSQNSTLDKNVFYNKTFNADYSKYRNSPYLGAYDLRFISQCALQLYQNIECGNYYTSLEAYENYVRKVLEAVVGDKQLCKQITILFAREIDFNASMSENGVLTINIGLLPQLRNEAELAIILAHEIGHYLNDDAVRNYGRYMVARYHTGGSGIFGLINGLKGTNDYYAFARDVESAADEYALRFIDASGYSFKKAIRAYKTMEDLQNRFQLQEGKIRKYWRTHPYAAERLDYLEDLSTTRHLSGQKNYLVDSLTFQLFRTLCYQECINVGFVEGQFDAVITLSFSRYLLEPADTNNLAVLIEALRRKLALHAQNETAERSFILGSYLSALIYKYQEFSYLNKPHLSVLQCLDKGLIDIRPEEIVQIKALELADSSQIEFTTNMEAYLYFKERAREQNLITAQHGNFFGQLPDYSNADSFLAANQVFMTNDLIQQKGQVHLSDTTLILLLPIWSSFSPSTTHAFELAEYLQLNSNFQEAIQVELMAGKSIRFTTELTAEHQHLLYHLMEYAYPHLKNKSSLLDIYSSSVSWLGFYPESFKLFNDLGVHTLYVCGVSARNETKLQMDFYRLSLSGNGKYTLQLKELSIGAQLRNELYPDFKPVGKELRHFIRYAPK